MKSICAIPQGPIMEQIWEPIHFLNYWRVTRTQPHLFRELKAICSIFLQNEHSGHYYLRKREKINRPVVTDCISDLRHFLIADKEYMENTVTQAPLAIFALMLLISPHLSARDLLHSGSYDQCVLESMRGITSTSAAEVATNACRDKFRDMHFHDTELAPEALGKIVIHAGFGYGIFNGSIYNGNNNYTVTQITILLSPMRKRESAESFVEGKKYNITLTVQPLTQGALSMPIPSDNTLEYAWTLTNARGHKSR